VSTSGRCHRPLLRLPVSAGQEGPPRRRGAHRSVPPATQICPELTNEPSAACSAAQPGRRPLSTISGSLPPFSSSALAPVRRAGRRDGPAGGGRADVRDDVDLRPRPARADRPSRSAARARRREVRGEAARRAPPVAGCAHWALCTTGVAVDQGGASRPQETATGSFHGRHHRRPPRAARTPSGRSPRRRRPACGPRWAGPSSAYWRSVPMPAPIDPAPADRLAHLRVMISASSSAAPPPRRRPRAGRRPGRPRGGTGPSGGSSRGPLFTAAATSASGASDTVVTAAVRGFSTVSRSRRCRGPRPR
jgi:hypothetical protein